MMIENHIAAVDQRKLQRFPHGLDTENVEIVWLIHNAQCPGNLGVPQA